MHEQFEEVQDAIFRFGVPCTILCLNFHLDDVRKDLVKREYIKEQRAILFSAGLDSIKPLSTVV